MDYDRDDWVNTDGGKCAACQQHVDYCYCGRACEHGRNEYACDECNEPSNR